MELADLSLRRRERGFLAGGTQTGKSTLTEYLRDDFLARYPTARCHIADTKPRYKAQWRATGRSAKSLYKKWDHGAFVPHSVLVMSPADMDTAWATGHRVTICSTRRFAQAQDDCVAHFYEQGKRGMPRLIIVDETIDFFHGNGMPRGSGAIVDCSRSGAEQDLAELVCSQRTKGISPQLMEHMSKLYAFALDAQADAVRYGEFGAPVILVRRPGELPVPMWVTEDGSRRLPTKPRVFDYWTKLDREHVFGPYVLTLSALVS
jgi:hypothetical protein